MKRWRFTPQKPVKRACERNPKAVQKWLGGTYPEIKRRACKENAEIYWGDETGVRNVLSTQSRICTTGKDTYCRN